MAMKEADIILATGGPGMVKAAYSSGKPALGVGAGNTPAIIDESADVKVAVNSILHSKTFDNGMICASGQSTIVLDSIYDAVKAEFAKRGAYFLEGEELDKVRKTIIINGALNAKIVGQKAHTIAKIAGVDVPETAKVLIGEVESVDISEEFAHEKLSPVLAMYRAKDIDDAFDKAEHLIADGGYGHTGQVSTGGGAGGPGGGYEEGTMGGEAAAGGSGIVILRGTQDDLIPVFFNGVQLSEIWLNGVKATGLIRDGVRVFMRAVMRFAAERRDDGNRRKGGGTHAELPA